MSRLGVPGLALLLGLGVGLAAPLAGCREKPAERKLPAFEGAVPADALAALAEAGVDGEVSVAGSVAEPPEGRHVLLDDGTGLVRVVLPDTARVPVGTRLLAQGLLRQQDGAVFVEAEEWHYDSAAVPVRLPRR